MVRGCFLLCSNWILSPGMNYQRQWGGLINHQPVFSLVLCLFHKLNGSSCSAMLSLSLSFSHLLSLFLSFLWISSSFLFAPVLPAQVTGMMGSVPVHAWCKFVWVCVVTLEHDVSSDVVGSASTGQCRFASSISPSYGEKSPPGFWPCLTVCYVPLLIKGIEIGKVKQLIEGGGVKRKR